MRKKLTFEDGVLLTKHVYQSAIAKTLQGVMEQEQIFIKAHEMLNEVESNFNHERLDELLYLLNVDNIYQNI